VGYVKLTGTANRHENWTTEYVLEVDDETGEPTKVVRAGEPVNLSAGDQKKLEAIGAVFEDSSKEEAEKYEAEAPVQVGADVAASGPLLGPTPSGKPNQSVKADTDQS